MNYIANIINFLYEYTNNLGYAVLIFSLIFNTILLIPKYINVKNQYIKSKYAKEVHLIKEENDDPSEQLTLIRKLYSKERYYYVLPTILNIIILMVNIMIFSVIINYKTYFNITEQQSFLMINDIFAPQWNIVIPLLCIIFNIIASNLFKIKEINYLSEIISNGLLFLAFMIYGKSFGQLYLIYTLGIYFLKLIGTLLFYKKQKQIICLNKEYSIWLEKNLE